MKKLSIFLGFALALGVATGLRYSGAINSALGAAPVQHIAIVEFAKVPTMETLFSLRKHVPQATSITRFDSFDSDYFRRAYQVTFNGEFADLQRSIAQSGVETKRIELSREAAMFSIVPSQTRANALGQDPLANYQWAISNDGQKILREIDDIHAQTIVADAGGPKIDIGLGQVRARMAKEAKRDMIVAVLDYGLDTNHEDITKNIYRNKAECDGDKIPFQPKEDKDGNGYKGDCMGWNFTAPGDGDNNVEDDEGHGTHVAGIIAAEIGNKIGIAGVAPRIKILPIKITKLRDSQAAMTARASKAILYAVKMKADVINFSMGWPVINDTEFLRQAFNEARKAGITIVAAAGNSGSAAPVFPCSYEGVICVGAVTISGEITNFSNYGGDVDLMAPGEEILSLYPKAIEPRIFSIKGYEIISGTSQAAPFVSAQAAILKALIPNITPDEIQARLMASTKAVKWGATAFGVNGLTDVSAALALKPQPVLRPDFKSLYKVDFTMQDRSFKFDLPFKNFWAPSSDVTIELSTDTPNVTLDQTQFDLGTFATGETKVQAVTGQIQSTDSRREVRIKVKITTDGKSESYVQQIVLTRRIEDDREIKTYPVVLTSARPDLTLSTVRSVRENESYPDFLFAEKPDEQGIALKMVRWKNGSFVEERPIELAQAKGVLFALRLDVNGDGLSDYVIASAGQTGDQKWIQFSYLNQNLQPIFGGQQDLRVLVEGAVIDSDAMESMVWTSAQTPYGRIAVPVFMTAGGLPKADQNPDPFAFEHNYKIPRVYYYEPQRQQGSWVFATRVYDNSKWLAKIRETLGLRYREDLAISKLLPQSPADFAAGRVRALVRVGASSLKTYRLITIEGTSQLDAKGYAVSNAKFSGQTFEGATATSTINLDRPIPTPLAAPGLASFYSPTLARLTTLNAVDPSRVDATQQVSPGWARDNLVGFIRPYTQGGDTYGFYLTLSQMIVRKANSTKVIQASDAIDRPTSISTDFFNSMFFPISLGEGNKPKRPAIYFDGTKLIDNRVFTWTVEDDKLIVPMSLNVEVPKDCKALAPRRFGTGGETAYVFLCTSGAGNAKTYSIKTLNVE